jgi:hypothetical protein
LFQDLSQPEKELKILSDTVLTGSDVVSEMEVFASPESLQEVVFLNFLL